MSKSRFSRVDANTRERWWQGFIRAHQVSWPPALTDPFGTNAQLLKRTQEAIAAKDWAAVDLCIEEHRRRLFRGAAPQMQHEPGELTGPADAHGAAPLK